MSETIEAKRMDFVFEIVGFLFVLLGIVGSFLPVLPGPLTGWVGLFLLHQSDRIPQNNTFLLHKFCHCIARFFNRLCDSCLGNKKIWWLKKGIIGSTIGLVIGLLFLGPLGIIVGPFLELTVENYSIKPSKNKP